MNNNVVVIAALCIGLVTIYQFANDSSFNRSLTLQAKEIASSFSAEKAAGLSDLTEWSPSTREFQNTWNPEQTSLDSNLAYELEEEASPEKNGLEDALFRSANWPQTSGASAMDNAGSANKKPIINLSVEQQLQTIIYGWELSQNSPMNQNISISQLFEDPDGDLLTTQIRLENPNGLHIADQGQILVQGAPLEPEVTTFLVLSARDNYHGTNEDAWVTSRFELPQVSEEENITEHPLIGGITYRLETTQTLGGKAYAYEVVYCQAFQFIDQNVYFAASENTQECPAAEQLQKVGHYTISDDSLIVKTRQGRQIWTTKKVYLSDVDLGVENYFTTVFDGQFFESYTMQKDKTAMEARLNIKTGEYEYQTRWFDYLIPISGNRYLQGIVTNYIFDRSVQGNRPEHKMDSDVNIKSRDNNLYCHEVEHYWYSSTVAGRGLYADIVSSSVDFDGVTPVHCGNWYDEFWQRDFVYFNLEYSDYDSFIPGEVYSYVMKPLPRYADRVEEIKLNFIYHPPTRSGTSPP